MNFPKIKTAVVSLIALTGCSSPADKSDSNEPTGTVTAAIELAPRNAGCAVITASGTTTLTRDLDLAPETSTIFSLSGVPIGSDVFTAKVYAPSCAQIGSASPTWVSDPITATVTADATVAITFEMRPASVDGGGALVGLNFPGTITETPLPTAASSPVGIVGGPDGNIWFAEDDGNKIGRITPAGVITEFPVPTADAEPEYITVGSDGNLWFTEYQANQVGRITPAGEITEYPITTAGTYPAEITAGPDGALWFTETNPSKIGRITTSGSVTEFQIPTANCWPLGITTGPDGNLWFVEVYANSVTRLTTAGVFTEFPIPTPAVYPGSITVGADGNLWVAEFRGNQIAQVTTAGVFTEFPLPTANVEPYGMVLGSDGNVWFAEETPYYPLGAPDGGTPPSGIGFITPTGVVTEFPTPNPASEPGQMARGADGRMWFTEFASSSLGVIQP